MLTILRNRPGTRSVPQLRASLGLGSGAPHGSPHDIDVIGLACFMGNDYIPKVRAPETARWEGAACAQHKREKAADSVLWGPLDYSTICNLYFMIFEVLDVF